MGCRSHLEALRSLAGYYDGLLRQQLTERDDQAWIS
jgi:hypothetical protein